MGQDRPRALVEVESEQVHSHEDQEFVLVELLRREEQRDYLVALARKDHLNAAVGAHVRLHNEVSDLDFYVFQLLRWVSQHL